MRKQRSLLLMSVLTVLLLGLIDVAGAQQSIRIGARPESTKEYSGADFSYHSAGGYSGCDVLVEAIKRAGSLDGEKVRAAILKLDYHNVYGGFKVDRDGFQIAHKMVMFQWQDGKKVIVWPEELAPGQPRFPTPAWNQR